MTFSNLADVFGQRSCRFAASTDGKRADVVASFEYDGDGNRTEYKYNEFYGVMENEYRHKVFE